MYFVLYYSNSSYAPPHSPAELEDLTIRCIQLGLDCIEHESRVNMGKQMPSSLNTEGREPAPQHHWSRQNRRAVSDDLA